MQAAADHLQQWAHLRQHSGFTPHQHGQRPRLGSFGAAGDRCIEVVHPLALKLSGGLLRALGADRGAVDHDAAWLEAFGGSFGAEQHRLHGGIVADAEQQHVHPIGGGGRAGAGLGPR